MPIKIEYKGIEDKDKRLQVGIQKALKLSTNIVMRDAKLNLRGSGGRNSRVDTGRLIDSITTRVSKNVGIVGTNVEYAPYIEFGTSAHFPPVAALEEWAQRKFRKKGIGFVIARAISRRGTQPWPF